MSWLLFMDESGHDHKQMPYEVRGGIALQDRRVWPFIRAVASLEENCFGVRLADFKKEFKGAKLLDKDRTAPGEKPAHEKREAISLPAATRAPGRAEPPSEVSPLRRKKSSGMRNNVGISVK